MLRRRASGALELSIRTPTQEAFSTSGKSSTIRQLFWFHASIEVIGLNWIAFRS